MKSKHILSLLVFLLCFYACKDNYYIEHELHGMWQVTSIERLNTDQTSEIYDGHLYYFFQRSMVMLGQKMTNDTGMTDFYKSHFEVIGSDSIRMGDFRYAPTYANSEDKASLRDLRKFGLFQDYTTFYMEQSSHKLILTSDSARIELRKY